MEREELVKFIGKRIKMIVLIPTKTDWDYVDELINEPLPVEMLEPKQQEVTGMLTEVTPHGEVILNDCRFGFSYHIKNITSVCAICEKGGEK